LLIQRGEKASAAVDSQTKFPLTLIVEMKNTGCGVDLNRPDK